MTYKVLIVGAGTKGAFYDRPGDEKVLSHAHAFTLAKGFEVVGFVDPDLRKAELACERWNVPMAYADGFEVREPIDVVVVATPDKTHANVIEDFLQLHPKLLICEKPFCSSLAEAQMIKGYCDRAGVPVLVNYTRRFSPSFAAMAACSGRGFYGEFLTGAAFYGNGFLHSAGHWVDLFLSLGIPPELVTFIEVDRNAVNFFEATLLFKEIKIEIKNHGESILYSKAIPRPDFKQESIYNPKSWEQPGNLDVCMKNMVIVADRILRGVPSQVVSTMDDAIKVHEFIEAYGHG